MLVSMNKYFITTPIYYINDKPHIGHAYSTIIADVLARYHRQRGDDVLFSAGVDENAQKTVNAAAQVGKDIDVYTQEMSEIWESTWKQAGISNDVFIRTTCAEHKAAVYDFITRVEARGDIYKGTYEGFYCVGCESFKKEEDLVEGLCPDHKKKPDWLKEENYFFALSKYQQPLLEYIAAHPAFIQPESRRNEIVAFIQRGLQDFSISRSTQKWGIPWPGDERQVVYVWFDALVNYLTVTGFPNANFEKYWPADVHIMAKDIIKFHCVYWPAMLMSAGLALPGSIFAHGFFTIDGQKISKSLGNTIDPVEIASHYGRDSLRYFLLREIPTGGDGDFSRARIAQRYESDLAKGIGNFVSRVLTLAVKVPIESLQRASDSEREISELVAKTWEICHNGFAAYRFDTALDAVWHLISWGDRFIEQTKPWVLLKEDEKRAAEVLGILVELVRQVGLLVRPILPDTSEKIGEYLGITTEEQAHDLDTMQQWRAISVHSIQKTEPLFPPR